MSLTGIDGLKSEIYVPITPDPVWTGVEKPLNEMTIAIVTAAGVHLKSQERFNLSGDTSYRAIGKDDKTSNMMVSHGGYDNSDVNKDINSMFPIDRLRELKDEKIIGDLAEVHIGFMGGGGDVEVFKTQTGPEIADLLKEESVDAVVMTGG